MATANGSGEMATEERGVYGCNGTEFVYVIFTEQRNFTTVERRIGNGRTATEWWKSGISGLRPYPRLFDIDY